MREIVTAFVKAQIVLPFPPAEQVVLKVPQELLFRQKDCSSNGQDSQHPDTDVADLEPHRRLFVLAITAHSNEYELLAIK